MIGRTFQFLPKCMFLIQLCVAARSLRIKVMTSDLEETDCTEISIHQEIYAFSNLNTNKMDNRSRNY